ncbi:hypothetical protein PIROE2DRAFT_66922, partial [Piromyces sp. E2]
MPQFLPPPVVKFFGTYNLDVKPTIAKKDIKEKTSNEKVPDEKEKKDENDKKN